MVTENHAALDPLNSTSLQIQPGRPKFTLNQPDASPDLTLISWPDGRVLPAQGPSGGYNYEPLAGSESYVYVIDYGINLRLPVGHAYIKHKRCLLK